MKSFILIVILLLVFNNVTFSQYESFYIQIEDEAIIPNIEYNLDHNEKVFKGKTDTLQKIYSKYKIKEFKLAFPTAITPSLKNVYIVKCNSDSLGAELKNQFKNKIPKVEYLCNPVETYEPDDYGLAVRQTNLDLINAKQAYDIVKDIPKITAAINDTYFDINHEDLNFIGIKGSNDLNQYPDAYYHGTIVAGDLAAITDNNIGIASIGFNTPLYCSTVWASDNDVLQLAQAGYRVINCSWYNSCTYSSIQNALYEEIRNIWNTVVVSGAGNNRSHCGNLAAKIYPASYNSVVSVTSVGHIYDYGHIDSSLGPVDWKDVHEEVVGDTLSAHHHNEAVDICAPGYNIASTAITGQGINGGIYTIGWGTSFAAPQVAGTLVLILSINPCLSANEAGDILLSNSDPSIYSLPANYPYIGLLGQGRLDSYASATAAAETATLNLQNENIDTQDIKSNYAINIIDNVNISTSSTVNFITRNEFNIEGTFEVPLGSSITINVDPNNPIYCP